MAGQAQNRCCRDMRPDVNLQFRRSRYRRGDNPVNTTRCFVISPIGEAGSSTRIRSDQILSYIIRPVATKCGYDVKRGDEIIESGYITTQVIERILNDELVIADLTERNPNVYYELAVRHAAGKPIIQLIQKGEALPFDVAGTRTIEVDHRDLDSVEHAKKTLAQFIEAFETAPPGRIESPISLALNLEWLRESRDPQQAGLADIVERMAGIHGAVVSIQTSMNNDFAHRFDKLLGIVSDLKGSIGKGSATAAKSELSDSIESLRARLVAAVSTILDEIQEQHIALAKKIQSVFEEQSETAADAVERSFAEQLAIIMPDDINLNLLLSRLVDLFMHGMKSMGTYQQMNVTEKTEASTHAIRAGIKKSIEDVFSGIDKIERQVIALPLPSSDSPTP